MGVKHKAQIKQKEIIRVCDFCGKSGKLGEDVIRIKFYNAKGKGRLIWACRDGKCR